MPDRMKKADHNGAKNMGHDKRAPRQWLKDYAKKLRRRIGKALTRDHH